MMFFTGLIAATEEALSANEIRDVVKLLNQLRNAKIKENSVSKKKKGKKKTRGAKVRCPPLTSLPACPHAWVLAFFVHGLACCMTRQGSVLRRCSSCATDCHSRTARCGRS